MDIIKKNIDDILDSKGKNKNFLTNESYSSEYIELAKKWSQLPMYTDKENIIKFFNLLNDNMVMLLISGTGSGKTVLVPKYVLKYNKILNISGKIAITNPKTLTTAYNAEYAAKTLDVKLGSMVGYKYKGSPSDAYSDQSELVYLTDGLLLAKILGGDKTLKEFNTVIIDEAHERGIQIDLLLKFLKEILVIRPEFKIIIMSATINPEVFRDYFSDSKKYGEIEVSGKSNQSIKQIWLDSKNEKKVNRSNYIEYAVKQCNSIIDMTTNGDIIIFVATSNDAIKGCLLLEETCPKDLVLKNKEICNNVFCVEVYSKMKSDNKEIAVSKDLYKTKYPNKNRKVIFATNIAESSITFDGLVYVIDSGFELVKYYKPLKNANVVNKVYTTQAQIKQRIGRVGRTQPGVAYHLYTQFAFNQLKKFPEPDIITSDLTDHILSIIKYAKNIKNTLTIIQDFITVPNIEQVIAALYKLSFIKAIKLITSNKDVDNKLNPLKIDWLKIKSYDDLNNKINGTITVLGHVLLRFRSVSLLGALSIIMAHYISNECREEIIKLVAINEISEGKIDSLFEYKNNDKSKFIKALSLFSINGSDHNTILNVYNNYYLKGETKYLNIKKFKKIKDRIIELTKYADSINPEKYEYINKKYNIIENKKLDNGAGKSPTFSTSNIYDMILYVLMNANKFNLLEKNDNMYKSKYYLDSVKAPINFSLITLEDHKNKGKNAVCDEYNEVFGRNYFSSISLL